MDEEAKWVVVSMRRGKPDSCRVFADIGGAVEHMRSIFGGCKASEIVSNDFPFYLKIGDLEVFMMRDDNATVHVPAVEPPMS